MEHDLHINSGDCADMGQANGGSTGRYDRAMLAEFRARARSALKNCRWVVWLTRVRLCAGGEEPGRKRRKEGRMRPDLAQASRGKEVRRNPRPRGSAQEKG